MAKSNIWADARTGKLPEALPVVASKRTEQGREGFYCRGSWHLLRGVEKAIFETDSSSKQETPGSN